MENFYSTFIFLENLLYKINHIQTQTHITINTKMFEYGQGTYLNVINILNSV